MSGGWYEFDEESEASFRAWLSGIDPSLRAVIDPWAGQLDTDPERAPAEVVTRSRFETDYGVNLVEVWRAEFRAGMLSAEVVYLLNQTKATIVFLSHK